MAKQEEKKCNSCGTTVYLDYVEFPCPNCGKEKIVRCSHCRELTNTYKCTSCSFEGP